MTMRFIVVLALLAQPALAQVRFEDRSAAFETVGAYPLDIDGDGTLDLTSCAWGRMWH
ncbi:hypothetical protein ACOI1H_15920 [Loktanella sp. DJP18]|uniref:hypothetical protein n=1 Tax=Loktanella sp. DJP18 TaxID=3409788 RepID=UPI003BB64FCC